MSGLSQTVIFFLGFSSMSAPLSQRRSETAGMTCCSLLFGYDHRSESVKAVKPPLLSKPEKDPHCGALCVNRRGAPRRFFILY
jgi:hypothetical protein